MYQNIPMELRERLQWVCAGPDKVPLNPRTGQVASVTDPGSWGSFNDAVNTGMRHVGFVLTDADPYCIIDLDNKPEKPLSEDEWKVHERILCAFPSYTERSASGRGYHVVTRGKLAAGRRRGNVEVYSNQRYMIFTGDVVRNAPIADCQPVLEQLVASMPETLAAVDLHQVDGELSDAEVHDMAMRAANGAKYDMLCRGEWQQDYKSQSDADFALISMLCFYTRDNEQVRRLFRYTALGKREKAQKNDYYLDLAIAKQRAKAPTPAEYEQGRQTAMALLAEAAAASPALPAPPSAPTAPPAPTPAPPTAPARVHAPTPGTYTLPPGLVGELASYFYSTAVRPVQEVALASAIGLMAGVVGRSYNVSGTGLNQYLLLVAKTGTGKEGGPNGIEALLAAVRAQVPMVDEFIGPGAFASGQAMIRVLDQKPSFVSILGEFGLTLQSLNDPRAPAAVVMLKRVLLDLYAKSGWNKVLRSTAYSDSDKNTKTIHAPNVSFLGDATPETFYDGISGSDIADGLIPRLQIIEYKGQRPSRNRNAGHPPPQDLANRFADIVALALTTKHNNTCAGVQIAPEALSVLDAFDEECDDAMRGAHNAGETQLWNRAHLKALKLAALLAVGVDAHAPCITPDLARWAVEFTRTGTEAVLARFDAGDVGNGDAKQLSELRRLVNEFFKLSAKELETYKVKPALQKAGVVPYGYLIVRASRIAAFYRDRNGAARALKAAIDTAVQSEVLGAHSPSDAYTQLKTRQAVYYLGPSW